MFGFFKSDPRKKIKKAYKLKLTAAMNAQRSGDIQGYARLTAEAEALLKQIESFEK